MPSVTFPSDHLPLAVRYEPLKPLPSNRLAANSRDHLVITTEEDLVQQLKHAQVDMADWGSGNAKKATDLLVELTKEECYLSSDASKLLRVLKYIEIELRYQSKVLVETHQELRDGRTRQVGTL